MKSWRELRRNVAPVVACTAVVILGAGEPAGSASLDSPWPLPLFVAGTVKRSVALALDKLRSDECRAIFTDFEDLEGLSLAEKLERRRISAFEHLASLRWVNGARHVSCQNPGIYLVATVGRDEIHVCPRQFSEYATAQPMKAAGLVLHEQLHALGLGENPPTSQEISRRVWARCGR